LYLVLGIFIPLIVTNCIIMARAEAYASKNTLWLSFKDGLIVGLGFAMVLIAIGMMREIIGQGKLFTHAHLLFGDMGASLEWVIFANYDGFLIAILPPGAFFALAILIALKNKREINMKNRSKETISKGVALNQEGTQL